MTLRDAARQTPADRDRVIDFARSASLAVVVLGHWLMASATVTGAGIRGTSALAELPWLTPLTWVLQVMPLFFVAGGFANTVSWRGVRSRGGDYARYMHARLVRLLRPTLVFVIAVPLVLAALLVIGTGRPEVDLVGNLLAQPLWFLGVYVAVTALAPAFTAWHERRPVAALVFLGVMAAGTDVVRFTGYDQVGYLNFGFVWLFAQQLGIWSADGRRPSRRALWAVLTVAIGLLVLLTTFGPYPVSMVGLPGEMSNMSPPTVCLLVLTVAQAAALQLLRPTLAAWLVCTRPWEAVVVVGSMAMTLYLWHLPVLVLGFGAVLWLDAPLPAPGTLAWWVSRPAWCAVLAAALAVLAVRLARLERSPGHSAGPGRPTGTLRVVVAGTGVAGVSAGLFGVVLGGLTPSTSVIASLAALGCGLVLTAWAASQFQRSAVDPDGPSQNGLWGDARERSRSDRENPLKIARLPS